MADEQLNPEAGDLLDVKAIIELFGGRDQVRTLLQEAGHTITLNGIQKWRDRQLIPTEWLIRLVKIARERKIQFSINRHIKKG